VKPVEVTRQVFFVLFVVFVVFVVLRAFFTSRRRVVAS